MNHALLKSEMADHERATQGRIRRPNRASRTPRLRATINHLREIGKKLADEFHSVFVLDCCGMVCTYLID